MNQLLILLSLIVLTSCNRITPGSTLSEKDIKRIGEIGLLDKNEKIIRFYSEMDNETAGNFFTNKRLAKYWLDKDDPAKTKVSSAYYKDIKTIDTVYYAGATYCPYMKVTTKDGYTFKVCADGEKEEIKAFFEEAMAKWKSKS
ncbi:hypothetical protein AAEO56_16000 [Flavobacterium sp. DGU11]|uniref:Lipoprotein n=1 Tax=Flavobacterium arundinis TaxID=3139143 RepID=A0ABU9I033_9FLAO